ncbi:CeGAL family transcription factor [Aspergillus mulundensis]|uniref:Putative Zn(II)2Cys6 transcription factor n=1 Tax=Aspergillus mulundensis TaxID=1810919 RepID=A0A3D8T5Q6_9EURO|nr:putative Zn(II)2Cys6 transcription factor [Aspergillus mulundensis]RDW93883.1 putative Zn(II)2Cys6 transcription factor [Aspergillus mulundensis]
MRHQSLRFLQGAQDKGELEPVGLDVGKAAESVCSVACRVHKKRGPPARIKQIREQQEHFRALHPGGGSADDVPALPNLEAPPTIAGLSNGNRTENPPNHGYTGLMSDTQGASWGGPDMEYWLPDTFNSQACPLFGFQGSNILVKETLPPIIDDSINIEVSNQIPFLPGSIDPSIQSDNMLSVPSEFWPSYIHETSLIPWIDVYFDRLHPTLPVLNRSLLFTQIVQQEHRRNPQCGAMILALCAFSLTQPIDISERPTSSSRSDQAKVLVNEATRMRTSSDFGEHPSIEAVLTSFFLFGYLFGSNQHNAARLRLREAIDLASTLGLNNPVTYAECSTEEKGQWLRTYLVLSVTERAYALQRQHPISFTGRPSDIIRAADELRNATQRVVSGIIVHTEKDAAGMMGLSLLMELFDAIDEDILICWNARCDVSSGNGRCQVLTEAKALSIYRNLARVSDVTRYSGRKSDHFDFSDSDRDYEKDKQNSGQNGSRELSESRALRDFLSETQCADILLTQKWNAGSSASATPLRMRSAR